MLFGYPRRCTKALGILDYQREQMTGRTMHVQCVKRLLRDIRLDALASTKPEDFEVLGDTHKAALASDPRAKGCSASQTSTESALPSDPQGEGGSLGHNSNESTGNEEARIH